jgi:hypothetical protein
MDTYLVLHSIITQSINTMQNIPVTFQATKNSEVQKFFLYARIESYFSPRSVNRCHIVSSYKQWLEALNGLGILSIIFTPVTVETSKEVIGRTCHVGYENHEWIDGVKTFVTVSPLILRGVEVPEFRMERTINGARAMSPYSYDGLTSGQRKKLVDELGQSVIDGATQELLQALKDTAIKQAKENIGSFIQKEREELAKVFEEFQKID